ncbi:hypothetical protein BDK51DRAFT_39080 [Blyttiomyces helicus]|uniref:Uncharacterized protein n=1 Tax=Blyttiomyces helicus TaxID=388810 RepID=A0A4P9W942_9FUNG|nr:hypothetical protein BDK51DRAFT_39080 [Blyttiomyces helicus]|eukprot:RKO87993.1 hypothetical protein BDK51DRAFT_39080 [Blyttiomyces helicus]
MSSEQTIFPTHFSIQVRHSDGRNFLAWTLELNVYLATKGMNAFLVATSKAFPDEAEKIEITKLSDKPQELTLFQAKADALHAIKYHIASQLISQMRKDKALKNLMVKTTDSRPIETAQISEAHIVTSNPNGKSKCAMKRYKRLIAKNGGGMAPKLYKKLHALKAAAESHTVLLPRSVATTMEIDDFYSNPEVHSVEVPPLVVASPPPAAKSVKKITLVKYVAAPSPRRTREMSVLDTTVCASSSEDEPHMFQKKLSSTYNVHPLEQEETTGTTPPSASSPPTLPPQSSLVLPSPGTRPRVASSQLAPFPSRRRRGGAVGSDSPSIGIEGAAEAVGSGSRVQRMGLGGSGAEGRGGCGYFSWFFGYFLLVAPSLSLEGWGSEAGRASPISISVTQQPGSHEKLAKPRSICIEVGSLPVSSSPLREDQRRNSRPPQPQGYRHRAEDKSRHRFVSVSCTCFTRTCASDPAPSPHVQHSARAPWTSPIAAAGQIRAVTGEERGLPRSKIANIGSRGEWGRIDQRLVSPASHRSEVWGDDSRLDRESCSVSKPIKDACPQGVASRAPFGPRNLCAAKDAHTPKSTFPSSLVARRCSLHVRAQVAPNPDPPYTTRVLPPPAAALAIILGTMHGTAR